MVLVTTASAIPGWEITGHVGVISSHVVAGTNIFSDFAASFTDIFGGRSVSYQKQLQAINNEVLNNLKHKTERLGGNSIIGLHIDHDQISGGNKSMFMVTAYGTAVKARCISGNAGEIHSQNSTLDSDQFQDRLELQEIVEKVKTGESYLNSKQKELLIRYRVEEIATDILKYSTLKDDNVNNTINLAFKIDFLKRYYSVINSEISKRILYRGITDKSANIKKICIQLIADLNLLDYEQVLNIIDKGDFEEGKTAISLLQYHKSYHSSTDIELLETLNKKIKYKFPVIIKVVENGGGLLSKSKEKWECQCGKLNDMNAYYCAKCNRDWYGFDNGFNPDQAMSLISQRLEVLRNYFKQ